MPTTAHEFGATDEHTIDRARARCKQPGVEERGFGGGCRISQSICMQITSGNKIIEIGGFQSIRNDATYFLKEIGNEREFLSA